MIKENEFEEPTPGTVVSSRRRFNYEQTQKLLDEFHCNRNPSKVEMESITFGVLQRKNDSDVRRVNQWYQNRRARENKKRWLRIKNLVTEDSSDTNLSYHFSPTLNAEQSVSSSQSSTPKLLTKQDITTALKTVTEAFQAVPKQNFFHVLGTKVFRSKYLLGNGLSMVYDDTTTDILKEFQQEFLYSLPY
ncbi:uncharacterized protein EV154DRAFT_485489 [Mucor mucedo]|uniref:uncharacterized protein n=1 Tax=Mucor mucedo TaxID=29922 RepID=UPI00221E4AEF|nr:uncharacterized protein EV154DRAFT_485489 [Mucor mucedo]KAI7883818.1 hypothetical protein EV154DRAFT_485489 [Mucor mucedo]